MEDYFLRRCIIWFSVTVIYITWVAGCVLSDEVYEEENYQLMGNIKKKHDNKILTNAGSHVYPYLASLLTYLVLLLAFLAVCKYGPNLG